MLFVYLFCLLFTEGGGGGFFQLFCLTVCQCQCWENDVKLKGMNEVYTTHKTWQEYLAESLMNYTAQLISALL